MRTFQEFSSICEELTGERRKRAEEISSQKSIPNAELHLKPQIMKKRRQARWLAGKEKDHPSQGFGSHEDPKNTRAPKNTIANSRTSPGVKKRKSSSIWKTGDENVPGKGMPQVDTLPRGKGSKAKRRAEALKKEN